MMESMLGLALIVGVYSRLASWALLYVTYQGFGVVTNTSGEMLHPNKELPRAMFSALAIVAVVYLVVSTLVVGLLSVAKMQQDAGHVLADAGEAVLGNVGFLVISGAAILATASAVKRLPSGLYEGCSPRRPRLSS